MLKLSRAFKLLFLVLIFLLTVGFTFFNTEQVALSFGFIVFAPQPLALWVLSAFISGGLVGLALGAGIFRRWRGEREMERLRAELMLTKLGTTTTHQVKQDLHPG
jgi:uncharacterized integral membrane protein